MNASKAVANVFIKSGLLQLTESREKSVSNMLRILVYHRLGSAETETGQFDPGLINSTPEMFRQQMAYIKEHYYVLSLDELLHCMAQGKAVPPRSVMITFDDNYREFLTTAWPTLKELNLPAILFIATDFSTKQDALFWWDKLYQALEKTTVPTLTVPHESTMNASGDEQMLPLQTKQERQHALKVLKDLVRSQQHHQAMKTVDEVVDQLGIKPRTENAMLSWTEIKTLSDEGLYIGAHTRSHPLLNRLTTEQAAEEIVGSQDDLAQKLGKTWPIFAYPYGNAKAIREELIPYVHQAGFQVAVTMHEGHNVIGKNNPLWLSRLGMAPHLSMDEFRLALTGVYNLYGQVAKIQSKVSL